MTVEIYESISEDSITVIEKNTKQHHIEKNTLPNDATLIRTISGKNWNDCMTKHHKLMGWEPYKPF